MIAPSIHDRVRRSGLPSAGLVVAVSGGPDSVALVRALLATRTPDATMVLAHLNHLLRGAESDADEIFVAQLQASLGGMEANVRLVRRRLDVRAIADAEGGNLEAVARRERYQWLTQVAQEHGLAHVATGHTASDQAETVLHRLLRGTGIDGLRGIAAQRTLAPGVTLIRPLLAVTREEVLAYLGEIGQSARQDASNDDLRLTRNRIRHELLPLLARQYNPRIAEVLGRLASQAEEVSRAEEILARELLTRAERPRAGSLIVLDAGTLGAAPTRLVRGVLRLVWHREGWPRGEMGYAEYARVADLLASGAGAHDLPGGVRARRRGQVVQLGRV